MVLFIWKAQDKWKQLRCLHTGTFLAIHALFQKFAPCVRSRLNSALDVMNRKTRVTPMPPHLHGQGHGALKFTWKWEINLSHLSMLTHSNSTDLNQNAPFMHLNHKFCVRACVTSQFNVIYWGSIETLAHLCKETKPECESWGVGPTYAFLSLEKE